MEKPSDKIALTLYYNSKHSTTLTCHKNDKLNNILKNYSNKIGEDFNSLIFLYNGNKIDDLTKPFKKILNNLDNIENKMIILVYKIDVIIYGNNVNINFILNSNEHTQKKVSRFEKMEKICRDYAREKLLEFNSLLFKYGGKKIDLNKEFDDIANSYDKKCLGLTIEVYIRNQLKVNFLYKNKKPYTIICFKEDNISDIFDKYISNNSLNKNNINFYYGNNPIKIELQQTFNQLITSFEDKSSFETLVNVTDRPFKKNKNEINIKVKDYRNSNHEEVPKKCEKKKIIISIIVILIMVVILLIIIFLKRKRQLKTCDDGYFIPDDDTTFHDCQKCSLEGCKKCNGTYKNNNCYLCNYNLVSIYYNDKIIKCNHSYEIGEEEKCLTCDKDKDKNENISCNIEYKLVNGKCKVDYHVKVIYLTTFENQRITLIHSHYLYKISRMIIDGKNVTPISTNNFLNIGYHTVYYKFTSLSYYFGPSTQELFFGCAQITEVSFSDFNEYIPDISFESMFNGCTQLTSVDLSKVSFDSTRQYSLSRMFKNCINLKYVNLNLKINLPYHTEEMFYNCKSLISLDLSQLIFKSSMYFDYMFYNCISLTSINLTGVYLKSADTIDFMFYNCISLRSLDLSSFKPNNLKSMKNVFSNCVNLSSINLNHLYTFNVQYMNELFYNCSSLTSIELSSFITQKVQTFKNMFAYCTSLKSVDITHFITNNLRDISGMFLHCHSLTSINLTNFVTEKVNNMSSVFSHCYSLKTIDLRNLILERSRVFNSMFSHCYSLERVNFNNKTIIVQSIQKMFYGCYSLTSVDLSIFECNDYISSLYDKIFYDCPNLHYVNIKSIYNSHYGNDIFNNNISSYGTLIINQNFYEKIKNKKNYVPSNWTISFA